MKTAAQIENIIAKLREDLEHINDRIADLNSWEESGQRGRNEDFFVAQCKCRDRLEKEKWQAEYRIRAYEYVLENPKAE